MAVFKNIFIMLFVFAVLNACTSKVQVKTEAKSSAFSFSISEFDNHIAATSTPTFQWTSLELFTAYNVSVSTKNDCSGDIFLQTNVNESQLTVETLADDSYFLCVDGVRDSKVTPASNSPYEFSVDTTVPGVYTITSASSLNSLTPTFTWSESVGSISYELKVSLQSDCSNPLSTMTTTELSYKQAESLQEGQSYFLCVASKDLAGHGKVASNSPMAFNVDVTPPSSFSITGPASTISTPIPEFTWSASSGASTYIHQVSTQANCLSSIVSNSTASTTTRRVKFPLANGSYYACVYAEDLAGNRTAAVGSPFAFTITNASWILGRDNSTTTGSETGVNGPKGVSTDGTRMYLVDGLNNRVLIWNSIPTSNQTPPDIVLGEENVNSGATSSLTNASRNPRLVSAMTLRGPNSVASDGTRLAVSDSANNRVLVWSSIPTVNNQPADIVIGQPDMNSFTQNNGGLSNKTLAFPTSVYFKNSKLFIADQTNNRVLIWNSIPTQNFASASVVVGQPDFTSSTANNGGVSDRSLSAPTSLYCDGTSLFVVDYSNTRVLKWSSIPTTNHQAANFVLGQPNFTTVTANTGGRSASTFSAPRAVDGSGANLFVADGGNNRVLVWNSSITADGQAANVVLGQSTFTTATRNSGGISGTGFSLPWSVASTASKLLVSDYWNGRVLIWNSIPTANFTAADIVYGQASLTIEGTLGQNNAKSLNRPKFVSFYGSNLFVSDSQNHRTKIWNALPTSSTPNADANIVVGQTAFSASYWGVTAQLANVPTAVVSNGTQLIVSENKNNRVLIYNSIPSANNASADIVLGQPSFTVNTQNNGGASVSTLYGPSGIALSGTKLIVADTSNHRVLIWNTIPTSNQQAADVIIGQTSGSSILQNVEGVTARTLSSPVGVEVIGGKLFVADSENHRILVWNSIPTSNFTPADFVLGQSSMTEGTSGTSLSKMSTPTHVGSDGTRLAVADSLNHRVLFWNTMPVTSNQEPDLIFGQSSASTGTMNAQGVNLLGLQEPWATTFISNQLVISDTFNNRILFVPLQ